jgi:hypothetical protein
VNDLRKRELPRHIDGTGRAHGTAMTRRVKAFKKLASPPVGCAAVVAVLALAGAAACGSSSSPIAPKWKVVVVE